MVRTDAAAKARAQRRRCRACMCRPWSWHHQPGDSPAADAPHIALPVPPFWPPCAAPVQVKLARIQLTLSDEVMTKVFSWLSPEDLAAASMVCRHWNRMAHVRTQGQISASHLWPHTLLHRCWLCSHRAAMWLVCSHLPCTSARAVLCTHTCARMPVCGPILVLAQGVSGLNTARCGCAATADSEHCWMCAATGAVAAPLQACLRMVGRTDHAAPSTYSFRVRMFALCPGHALRQ